MPEVDFMSSRDFYANWLYEKLRADTMEFVQEPANE